MHQKLNTSILGSFLAKLEEESFIFLEKDKIAKEFGFFANFMLRRNMNSAMFYNLQGVDQTIGFLVIMTIPESNRTIDEKSALPAMTKAAQKIGALINFTELDKRSKLSKQSQ